MTATYTLTGPHAEPRTYARFAGVREQLLSGDMAGCKVIVQHCAVAWALELRRMGAMG